MNFNGKKLEDGSLEVTIRLSKEQAEALAASAKEGSVGAAANVHSLSWGKTEYCVTCSGGRHRETIEAYGDVHANLIALSICGGGYGLQAGKCR